MRFSISSMRLSVQDIPNRRNDKMLKAALDKYLYEIAAAKKLSLKANKKKAEEVATI